MKQALLEAKVLATVEAAKRDGRHVEDDFLEAKSTWPTEAAARQLAGSCNRAAGAEVIYVIGLDEKTGQVASPAEVDPSQWWAKMQSGFDQVSPDLINHMRIDVDESSWVVALAFDTSRAPYVVKNFSGKGPFDREVPMREMAGTRSAYRRELIRLLALDVRRPSTVVLSASAFGERRDPRTVPSVKPPHTRLPAEISIYWNVHLFLEHLSNDYIFLPEHEFRGWLRFGGHEYRLTPRLDEHEDGDSAFVHGVQRRRDGVMVTGPGVLKLSGTCRVDEMDWRDLKFAPAIDIGIELGVTGASAPIKEAMSLRWRPVELQMLEERRVEFSLPMERNPPSLE